MTGICRTIFHFLIGLASTVGHFSEETLWLR